MFSNFRCYWNKQRVSVEIIGNKTKTHPPRNFHLKTTKLNPPNGLSAWNIIPDLILCHYHHYNCITSLKSTPQTAGGLGPSSSPSSATSFLPQKEGADHVCCPRLLKRDYWPFLGPSPPPPLLPMSVAGDRDVKQQLGTGLSRHGRSPDVNKYFFILTLAEQQQQQQQHEKVGE